MIFIPSGKAKIAQQLAFSAHIYTLTHICKYICVYIDKILSYGDATRYLCAYFQEYVATTSCIYKKSLQKNVMRFLHKLNKLALLKNQKLQFFCNNNILSLIHSN